MIFLSVKIHYYYIFYTRETKTKNNLFLSNCTRLFVTLQSIKHFIDNYDT